MAASVRAKRVSDPLDDRVRDRLVGRDQWWCLHGLSYGSSGSEHSSDDNSPCLSEMVLDFIEDGCPSSLSPAEDSSEAEVVDEAADCMEAVGEIRRIMAVNDIAKSYRKLLLAHVAGAVEMASESGFQTDRVLSRREFMTILRELEHNAAICKTKWGGFHGVPVTAGNYEFIDVVKGQIRYFIDPNFAAQFEIARPTVHYSELLKSLPRVFVGTGEELKRIVRIMCDAAKRSLSRTELSVPPWRKNSYMQKKWFGPYRRTVNPIPDKTPPPESLPVLGVKCRSVGFDTVVSDVGQRRCFRLHQMTVKAVR